MTVKELMKELKKVKDKDLPVFWADHDHGEYEINDEVRKVWMIDRSEMEEKHFDKDFDGLPEKYITIRG